MMKLIQTPTLSKLLELSALQDWFNTMWGIDLEVNVVTAERRDNDFFSKEFAEETTK